jgi:hypothetical protein
MCGPKLFFKAYLTNHEKKKKKKKQVANIGKYFDFLKQIKFSIINFYIK